ncbi:MAG: membrane protein of unknown function [Promethearchaeota archaeon]|nr:MAG: membrane protein of unknown function [Candidatus Lokiarchaeota archaeon]
MGIHDISELELFYGIFNLLFISIIILIGVKIISTYFSHKREEFITIGLTLILLFSGYWSVTLNFILLIFFNSLLPIPFSIFLERFFIPVGVICWIYSFGQLVVPHLKQKLVLIFSVICVSYMVFLTISAFVDYTLIAEQVSTFYTQNQIITLIFDLFAILSVIITFIIFAKSSLSAPNENVRLKGKLLLIGGLLITSGIVIDTLIPLNILILALTRIIFILGALFFYFGFFYSRKVPQKESEINSITS